MLEVSKIMAEAFPKYAKKLPKKEMPNFMVKLISYLDSSVKIMLPDLGILMQTDTSYSEDLLGMKFKPAKESIVDSGNSVIRLGLV
jgi:dihydroflavonol-4-reductase